MGDKSVPEITIKLNPPTLTGFGLAATALVSSWVLLWFHGQPLDLGSMESGRLNPGAAVETNPGDNPIVSLPTAADLPNPADLSRDLQEPLPRDSVWVTPDTAIAPDGSLASQPSPNPATAAVPTPLPGLLRMGNQTPHPVRVALLQRSPQAQTGGETLDLPPTTTPAIDPQASPQWTHLSVSSDSAVHWDFAPGEGFTAGLILSLPTGDLTLTPGDIVVAFAQDGSQRYWGPFVVGETELPIWNGSQGEWQLLLQSTP